jgi:glycosyltransferase involved in cell wall biosynthesis
MTFVSYRIMDLELSRPFAGFALASHETGYALVVRWEGRIIGFLMKEAPEGLRMDEEVLREIVERDFALRILTVKLEASLMERWPATTLIESPSLTIAICTKDRAARLARLLDALEAIRGASEFRALEVLVVDNASVDSGTREVVESRADVRYRFEPKTGLDFARNAALETATGDLIAYLDDDVVVDRGWLAGLYRVWADCPDAGGYSGLVLPYRLETPAQIRFEREGGFGRGFERIHHRGALLGNPLHPVGAGVVGAGANMCFRRDLLLELGGFDEALDTGAPLPGGGDLDIFYRVLRSGHAIVYEPRYAVFHEHRETMAQLRRQYWSWGLGFMAFLEKARRTDPGMRLRQDAMVRWWFRDKLISFAGALSALDLRRAGDLAAELRGAIQGLLGEYDRSLARSRRIREQVV